MKKIVLLLLLSALSSTLIFADNEKAQEWEKAAENRINAALISKTEIDILYDNISEINNNIDFTKEKKLDKIAQLKLKIGIMYYSAYNNYKQAKNNLIKAEKEYESAENKNRIKEEKEEIAKDEEICLEKTAHLYEEASSDFLDANNLSKSRMATEKAASIREKIAKD